MILIVLGISVYIITHGRIFSKPRELNEKQLEPLFKVMDDSAKAYNKTLAQVAINWLMRSEEINVIPIPGVRNLKQINDNLGALGWNLTKEERSLVNKAEFETRI